MDDPATAWLTLGAVARHFRVPVWKVRRLYERAILPPASRVGAARVVLASDLPTVESALLRAGYLPSQTAPASSGPPQSFAPQGVA